MTTQSLSSRVGSFWTGQQTAGHKGLMLLDECIRHAASEHRDTDAMARFLSRAGADRPKISAIIVAAFGDQIKWKADKLNPNGGKFILGWDGSFPIAKSNTYGVVSQAIEHKKSFRCQELQKALRAQRGKPEAAAKELDVVVKAMMVSLGKASKVNSLPVGVILEALRKQVEAAKAKAA